jgi:hypothetical protein
MRLWSSTFVLISVVVACGGGSKGPADPTIVDNGTGTFAFQVSPVALAQIRFIVPLGNLNPPGHTTPTDHIYFYFADPGASESPVARRTDFFAPANGTVTSVIDNGVGADRKIMFCGTTKVSYYIDHLIPTVMLTNGTQVKAGDRLGTTGSSFGIDLGITNQDVTLTGLLNLSRYPAGEEHTDAPVKYFTDPLRGQLYAKVRRLGPDLDGRFDYDVAGRLSGNWFGDADQAPLSFAYDTYDPALVRIATSSGLALAPAVFEIAAADPAPRDVSVASGLVTYSLARGGAPVGHMLVQMLDDQRIRVEVFAPATMPATAFTGSAKVFVR